MTRDQIAAKIRRNLNDEGITYYSADDINESIQDGYDEVAVFCECIDKRSDINYLANRTYYEQAHLPSDFYRVSKIFNNSQNYFLAPSSDRDQLQYRNNWETIVSNPREFTILDPTRIGISGRSSNPTGSFKLFYKAQAPILSSNTTPIINENYQLLLELYGTADLLEQAREFQKADKYWQQYDPMLVDYRSKIQLLAKADRVFTRR